jgi:plasmid stability protein
MPTWEDRLRGYMAPIRVRSVDDSVVRKLRQRAARHGRSMNDEVCNILANAVSNEDQPRMDLARAVRIKRNRRTPAR